MLKVTIEMIPFGVREDSHVIHTGTITNDGSGSVSQGNYRISLGKRNGKGIYKEGYIKGFSRKQDGAWKLLLLGLQDCFAGPTDEPTPRGEDAMAVLLGRSGFDDWWHNIDADIRLDIMNELNEVLT